MAFGHVRSRKIKPEINHLYIHIPFCCSKCHYCAFYSQLDISNSLQDKYFAALKRELIFYTEKYLIKPKTIYIGGGNPGCVPNLLNNILLLLKNTFDLNETNEFTVECNPTNVNEKFVSSLVNNFVSRVSLGVQTFDEETLLKVNRTKQSNRIVENALNLLRELDNVSIDLINGLPEVDLDNELEFLDKYLKSYKNLNHISFYDLTIDENSYFYSHKNDFSFPDDDKKFVFEQRISKLLTDNNFVKYEISNWMRNSQMSRHNFAYWIYEDYLGIGTSAHSKIGKLRIENKPDILCYANSEDCYTNSEASYSGIADYFRLTDKESLEEVLLMGFRTIYGISRDVLRQKCGNDENFGKLLSFLSDRNFLNTDITDRIALNDKGRLILDSVLVELFEILDTF